MNVKLTGPRAAGAVAPADAGRKDKAGPAGGFRSVMEKVRVADSFTELTAFEGAAARGAWYAPRELLSLQIKVSQLQLKVELCSKLADGLAATVKKFQTGH